ncbi:MAG: hypothetical protein LQ337_008019 [Flavoplaca oasis]|nr:MAG: hypothetical protein LQ337_008019 [Flavoplaca oasis]
MAKRSCGDDDGVGLRRRKRVAFGMAGAATKMIIKRNAATSPLLTLPSELRDKIWTEVLGGRLLHLDFDVDDYASDPGEYYWKHSVCQHDCLEDRSDRKWKPHAECRLRYNKAYALSDDPYSLYDNDALMHLTLLRASRQIYVEANRILWTTNTFSFNDGQAFGGFMRTRSNCQKQLIRSLRFEMRWGWGEEALWNTALGMTLIRSLTGLRTLRLQIVCNVKKECWDYNKDRFGHLSTYTEGLRKLSILPLKSTEIVIRTSTSKRARLPGLRHRKDLEDLWENGDREKCAEDLKALLLDPNGADLYADYHASRASRKAELEAEMGQWYRTSAGRLKPWLAIP